MHLEYVTDGRRHLVCRPYSVDNLHLMAERLGLARHWFHGGDMPHYDLPVRRKAEIEMLCTVVPSKVIVQIIRSEDA